MNDQDTLSGAKRLRICSLEEQQEFALVGRRLLATGVTEAEMGTALGYDGVEGVRSALETGRITTMRLERMRAFAKERLGPDYLPDQGKADVGAPRPPDDVPPAPPPDAARRGRLPEGDGAEGRKEYLTRAQHRRLRDHVECLWAADGRLRNWSLLARAGGLSSGQAMKRAYEVGSSLPTLRNVETFRRLHAAFGSRATAALVEAVPIDELQGHLTAEDGTAPAGSEPVPEADARVAGPRAETAHPGERAGEAEATAEAANPGDPDRARGRKKEHLTPEQHRELREHVDRLRAADRRLRSWSLLARAAGLRSGFAMKRAYDVNSSVRTLRSIAGFARLLGRFGPAATDALRAGVPLEDVEGHLERTAVAEPAPRVAAAPVAAAPEAGPRDAAGPERRGAPAPDGTGTDVAAGIAPAGAPPRVDFARMLEAGHAIDAEVERLWDAARLFEGLAGDPGLPRIVRTSAGLARDRLRSVIALFAAEGDTGPTP